MNDDNKRTSDGRYPNVSVIMSCYNAGQFVAEAIESILHQAFQNFEFVIIDDGSMDDTFKIIHQYALADERIVVIKKTNTGLTNSLNIGIRASRGQWIARLDADDVAPPNRLSAQLAFLQANPSVLLLGTGCILLDQSGRQVRRYEYPTGHDSLVHHMEVGGPMFPHSSAMFLKKTVIQLGSYNFRFLRSQDKDLWLRISEIGRIACLREPLIGLRKHAKQTSYNNHGSTQIITGILAIVCHYLRLYGAPDPSLQDEDTWRYFVTWITQKLEEKGFVQMSRDWINLRQQWYAADCSGIARGFRLALGVLRSQKGYRMITQRLYGTRIPEKLANEWKSTSRARCKTSV